MNIMTQIQTQNSYSKVQGDAAAYSENANAAAAASGQAPTSSAELLTWLEQTALPYYQALMNGQAQASPDEIAQLEQWIAWANEQLVASGQTGFDLPQDYQNSYAGSPSGLPPEPNGLRPGMGEFYVANNQENSLYMTFPDASNSYPTYVWGDSADIFSNQSDVEITYEHGKDPLTDQACIIVKVTSPSTGQTKIIYVMEAESKINIHAVHSDRKVKANSDGNFANVHIEEFKAEAVQEQQNPNTPERKEGETEIYDRAQLDYFVNNCGSGTAYIYASEVNFVDVPPSAKINVENTKMPDPDGREAIKATITLSDGTTKVVYILKKPGQVISWHYVTEDQFMGTVDANKLKALQKYGNQQDAIEFKYHGGAATPAADTPVTGHAGDTQPNMVGGHLDNMKNVLKVFGVDVGSLEGNLAGYSSHFNVSLHASFGETRLHMISNAETVDIYPQGPNDIIETHFRNDGQMIVTIYKNGDRNQPEVFVITPPKKVNIHGTTEQIRHTDDKSKTFFEQQATQQDLGSNAPDSTNEDGNSYYRNRETVTISGHNDGESHNYTVETKELIFSDLEPEDEIHIMRGANFITINIKRADGTIDSYSVPTNMIRKLDFGGATVNQFTNEDINWIHRTENIEVKYTGKVSPSDELDETTRSKAMKLAEQTDVPVDEIYANEALMTTLETIDEATMERANKLATAMGIKIEDIYANEDVLLALQNPTLAPRETLLTFLAENDRTLSGLLTDTALENESGDGAIAARKAVKARLAVLLRAAYGDVYEYNTGQSDADQSAATKFNWADDFFVRKKGDANWTDYDIIENGTADSSALRFAELGHADADA